MELSQVNEWILKCNRCGFCQAGCPIFRSTGHEVGVARGRLALLNALEKGDLAWSREIEEPLFTCLLCEACTSHCFPAVPTADLILAARKEYLERTGRKTLHRLLFDHLLPHPSRLRLAAKAAAAGQKGPPSLITGALGLLRFLGRDMTETLSIIGRLPTKPLREQLPPQVLPGQGRLAVAYFTGCGMDVVYPDAARATLTILSRIGRTVEILNNNCCGLPANSYGDRRAAQKLAEKNLNLLAGKSFDLIVTDCSSCAAFLKKYPSLFQEGDPRQEKAGQMSALVKDLVEILNEVGPISRNNQNILATYHDPCHAVRGQKLASQPRQALLNIPHLKLKEMKEADWCCGGAGSYSLSHYDLARKVIDRKTENIARTKAEVLLTSCPSCLVHLDYGCRLKNLPIKVAHISQAITGNID